MPCRGEATNNKLVGKKNGQSPALPNLPVPAATTATSTTATSEPMASAFSKNTHFRSGLGPDSGSESWKSCLRSGGEAGRPRGVTWSGGDRSLSPSLSLYTLYVIKCQALRRLRWRERDNPHHFPLTALVLCACSAEGGRRSTRVRASVPHHDEMCVLPQYVFYFIFT